MGSRTHRLDLYDPKTLESQASEATWVTPRTRDPFRDFETDLELKKALSLKLTALAEDGVTDPVELLERALESLAPSLTDFPRLEEKDERRHDSEVEG